MTVFLEGMVFGWFVVGISILVALDLFREPIE